jgi:hypothetical protein
MISLTDLAYFGLRIAFGSHRRRSWFPTNWFSNLFISGEICMWLSFCLGSEFSKVNFAKDFLCCRCGTFASLWLAQLYLASPTLQSDWRKICDWILPPSEGYRSWILSSLNTSSRKLRVEVCKHAPRHCLSTCPEHCTLFRLLSVRSLPLYHSSEIAFSVALEFSVLASDTLYLFRVSSV